MSGIGNMKKRYNIRMENKIRITRTLLDKNKDELTEEEKELVDEFNEERSRFDKRISEENERIASECSILCSGGERCPIPDYGWIRPVKRLCYALENLNHDFRKYGISVVLDQTKEKYGTLRFYTHINTREIGFWGLILNPLDKIVEWMSNINFGRKLVTDKPEYRTVEWREITKEQFDTKTNEYGVPFDKYGNKVIVVSSKKEVKNPEKIERNTYLVEEDGKFFYSYTLYHMAETHVEYTKHFLLRKIRDAIRQISTSLDRFYKEPKIQAVKIQEMDYRVDELVRDAERECMKVCQHCGADFGDYYKQCETQGWYMYLCQRCADATGMEYVMDGKHYMEGVDIYQNEPKENQTESNENGIGEK